MRAFIAVDMPVEAARGILAFMKECKEAQKDGIRCVDEGHFHITLRFLGEIGEDMVTGLARELAAIRQKSMELLVSGAGAFPDLVFPKVLWVGLKENGDGRCPGLSALAADVGRVADSMGMPSDGKPFKPHVTVARMKTAAKKGLSELVRRNASRDFGSFKADSFVLYSSVLKPDGPVYTPIERFKLETL